MFHTSSDNVAPFTMIGAIAIMIVMIFLFIACLAMLIHFITVGAKNTSILQLIIPIVVLTGEILFFLKMMFMKRS